MITVGSADRDGAEGVDVERSEARFAGGAGGEQLELDDVTVGIDAHHRAGDAEVGGEHDPGPRVQEVKGGDEVGGVVDRPPDVGHPHLVGRVGRVTSACSCSARSL